MRQYIHCNCKIMNITSRTLQVSRITPSTNNSVNPPCLTTATDTNKLIRYLQSFFGSRICVICFHAGRIHQQLFHIVFLRSISQRFSENNLPPHTKRLYTVFHRSYLSDRFSLACTTAI
jgi:hypothetical protein